MTAPPNRLRYLARRPRLSRARIDGLVLLAAAGRQAMAERGEPVPQVAATAIEWVVRMAAWYPLEERRHRAPRKGEEGR